jgi:hypothetical protein
MVAYIASDLKDPDLRSDGLRRIAGMSFAYASIYAAQAALMAAFGVDDDEEEALRSMSAPWSANSNLVPVDRDARGRLWVMDLSFIDPYAYYKRPINALLRDQPTDDALKQAAWSLLDPFFGEGIVTQAIREAKENKKVSGGPVYNPRDGIIESTSDIANHMRKALQPGFVAWLERVGMAAGGKMSPSGQPYTLKAEAAAFFGFRSAVHDPRKALWYRAPEFVKNKSDSTYILTKAASNPNAVSDDALLDAYGRAKKAHADTYADMLRLVRAAKASGMAVGDIRQVLKDRGVSAADVAAMVTDEAIPKFELKRDTFLSGAEKKARNIFSPEQSAEFKRRRDMLLSHNRADR